MGQLSEENTKQNAIRLKQKKAKISAIQNAVAYIAEMKPHNIVILTYYRAPLQSLIFHTSDQPTHQLPKHLHRGPTVDADPLLDFRKWKNRSPGQVWEWTNATPILFHLTGSQNPAQKQSKMPMETTTPLLTQSTVWQDMSRPLYSGCKQDATAYERTWSELVSRTLYSAIAKTQNRRSTTSSRTVPSGGNKDTSDGRRMSQPPTSCGERRKTCAAPPSSWQHVDWGSKHSLSIAEGEECALTLWTRFTKTSTRCILSCFRRLYHCVGVDVTAKKWSLWYGQAEGEQCLKD